MLPPNLLIMSMVVFLATAASSAPVEEKEQEEVEVEVMEEVEGELSEEEEDDDDSKSQDRIEGAPGQQTTPTAALVLAAGGSGVSKIQDLSVSISQSEGGRPHDGAAGSSTGSVVDLSVVAPDQTPPPAAQRPAASSHSETNGNGQKLLNGGGGAGGGAGGGGGGADSQTGGFGSFGGGASHLDFTGMIVPSSHDFLLGIMGGGDSLSPDGHIHIPDHMSPSTHLDSTVMTPGPPVDLNGLDSPADPAHHSDTSLNQPGPDHTSLTSGSDQSLSSSVSGPSHSTGAAASSSSSHSETHREPTDGADSADTNGNGRQTLIDAHRAVTDPLVSFSDLQTHNLQNLQTEVTGGADSVTSLQVDLSASGLGLGRDVTESSPVILHTESVDGITARTLVPASGVYSHTDLVTVTADSTVTAGPTGTPLDSSYSAVMDHTQTAGPVTEQYNPSGQGPEGAENVELEDTC